MWSFKSQARREREALEDLGCAITAGFAEGIRLVEAGEPVPPLSPEAEAMMERMLVRSGLLFGAHDD